MTFPPHAQGHGEGVMMPCRWRFIWALNLRECREESAKIISLQLNEHFSLMAAKAIYRLRWFFKNCYRTNDCAVPHPLPPMSQW